MKIRKLMIACLMVAFASVASAAPITWSDPIPNALPDTAGDLVEAVNMGGVAVTAGGINFADGYQSATDSMYANFVTAFPDCWDNGWGSAANDTGDAGLNELLKGHRWRTGETTTTLTLSNLTVGIPYQIQLYFTDDRGCCNTRPYYYSDGLGNDTEVFTRGSDVSFIATFVADAATQDIQCNGQNGQTDPGLCAYVLRDLSGMAFDPAPRDGQDEVPVDVTLEWNTMLVEDPADPNLKIVNPDLVRHEVYLSNGDPADPNVTSLGSVAAGDPVAAAASYGPLSLDRGNTYYWRVDEVVVDANSNEVTVEGALWSFETVPSIPMITADPANQMVNPDTTVSVDFAVEATNPFYPNGSLASETDGLAYQWQFDGGSGFADLTGETASILTVTTTLGDGNEGSYRCQVSITNDGDGNTAGVALSGAATLVYKKLIAEYKFDDHTDGLVAVDTSGFGNDAGIAGATYVEDAEMGWVLSFDGDGDVVSTTQPFLDHFNTQVVSEVTCSFWVYGGETVGTTGNVIAFWSTTPDATNRFFSAELPWTDGNIYYNFGRDCCSYRIAVNIGTGENAKGKWNHYLFTRNAETGDAAVYLNGKLQGDGNVTHPFEELDSFTIGGNSGSSYDGKFKNFRLYNYEFSAEDAAQAYFDETGTPVCVENPEFDLDGDCVVELGDFAIFASEWMECNLYPASACDE